MPSKAEKELFLKQILLVSWQNENMTDFFYFCEAFWFEVV